MKTPDGRMDTVAAAEYMGSSKSKMDQDRHQGRGPRYVKLGGRVWYFQHDLDDYIRAAMVDPGRSQHKADDDRSGRGGGTAA